MLSKFKQRKDKGFTIIEILIVLAIAGLILLVVFLAVPALQRNARNTQRRNDVQNLLGAVNEYISNNNGQLPPAAGGKDDILANTNLGFYTDAEVNYPGDGGDINSVYIVTGAKCDGNAVTTTGATNRNYVAHFWVETSSGTAEQCQES